MSSKPLVMSRACIRDTLLMKRLCPEKMTGLSDTTLNQIPVVRVDGLEYRTWYIRITAFYDKIFDHNYTIIQTGKNAIFTEESLRDRYDIPEDMDFTFIPSASGYDKAPTRGTVVVFSGKYDIRIDGIRVYNTLGTSLDKVETYAYAQAGEGVANIINVNDSLVDATNANAWADSAVSGINGVLYTAASSSTSTETAVTDGIIMGMEGLLYTNPKLPTDGTKPDSATRYYVFEVCP